MLVNRPKQVVCKIGPYNIIVASDNQLEEQEKFDAFCQEFKIVLKMVSEIGARNHDTKEEVKQ